MKTKVEPAQEAAAASMQELIWLCKRAGERFDLVQAAGGNASMRTASEELVVKGSGVALSAVTVDAGFATLDNTALLKLLDDLRANASNGKDSTSAKTELERLANEGTERAKKSGTKPSIETLLHTLLGPFTLHTHPLAVTSLVCRSDWKELARELFPHAGLIPYVTPGVRLALAIYDAIETATSQSAARVLFLENHGLVVAAKDVKTVMDTTNAIVGTLNEELNLDLQRFAVVNTVSDLINKACRTDLCAYLVEDPELKSAQALAAAPPAFPDQAVYAGPSGLVLDTLADSRPVTQYVNLYGHPPKVVLHEGKIFIMGDNIRKCRDAEEVLKAHVMTLRTAPSVMKFLEHEEVEYLLQWDAEKYRQRL